MVERTRADFVERGLTVVAGLLTDRDAFRLAARDRERRQDPPVLWR